MAKVKKHITKTEDALLRELRGQFDGAISEANVAEMLAAVKRDLGVTNTATYELNGETPSEWMQDNFGKPIAPDDLPGEPDMEILIDYKARS